MLSGIGPILMRVRISFDALRLCALVAAGVTSGYLWRAAFESSSPQEVKSAATPRVVQPAPAPPVVRIHPRQLTRPPAVAHPAITRTPPSRAGNTPTLVSAPAVLRPTPKPSVTTPKPGSTPQPTPSAPTTPTPTPAPAPAPATPAPASAP